MGMNPNPTALAQPLFNGFYSALKKMEKLSKTSHNYVISSILFYNTTIEMYFILSQAVSLFEQIRKTYFFLEPFGLFGGTQTALNFFCFLLRFCDLCSSPKKKNKGEHHEKWTDLAAFWV